MKKHYKPSKNCPLSGGIIVGEVKGNLDYVTGEYVTLVPGRLIWGLHNSPIWIHKVGEGYLFNLLGSGGEWYDFIPDYTVPSGRYLKRRGGCRFANAQTRLNRKNGVFVLMIWDHERPMTYQDLIASPKD